GIGQLRIERQVETRLAGPRVGGEEANVLVLLEDRLHLLHLFTGGGERSAFLQAQLEDKLGPRAVREELLRDESRAADRHRKCGDGCADGPPAARDGEVDQAAELAIDRGVVNISTLMMLAEVFGQ